LERNESFQAGDLQEIIARLAWAQLEAIADDTEQIQVIASGDERTVSEMRIEKENGTLTIEQPQYGLTLDITHGHWIEIVVRVPKTWDHNLRLNTISGLVRLRGLGGESIAAETITGDLKASQLTASSIALRTTAGAVKGTQLICETLACRSVSGNITLEDVSAKNYRFTTVSGDIRLDLGAGFEQMEIRTVSGDCELLTEMNTLNVSIRSVSGHKILNGVKATNDKTAPSVRLTGVSGNLKINLKREA
jgi:hypothetical protein